MTEGDMISGVRDAEDRRVSALIARDYDAFAALLSDKLVYHHASGKVDGKESYLAQFRAGKVAFVACRREQVTIAAVGGAVICAGIAHNELEVEGRPVAASIRYFSVWGHEGGRWLMAAWSSAAMP